MHRGSWVDCRAVVSRAMVELRTNKDATVALALDGISMEADDAQVANGNGV